MARGTTFSVGRGQEAASADRDAAWLPPGPRCELKEAQEVAKRRSRFGKDRRCMLWFPNGVGPPTARAICKGWSGVGSAWPARLFCTSHTDKGRRGHLRLQKKAPPKRGKWALGSEAGPPSQQTRTPPEGQAAHRFQNVAGGIWFLLGGKQKARKRTLIPHGGI